MLSSTSRTSRRSLAAGALIALLTACQPIPAPPPRAAEPTTPPAVTASATAVSSSASPTAPATTAPATTAPATVPADETYTNPVLPADFPDPHVLRVGDTYYAYATNTGGANIPVVRSRDLENWERLGDAVPALPQWAAVNQGFTWAPGVIQIGETFVMYHVARDAESDRQCISRAVSASPEGPFTDDSERPFVCQVDLGGSIDAYPFQDEDGELYLYWKNDGNCCGKPVGLWAQQLSDDGLSLLGQPTEVLRMDQPWERPLIENPAMVEHENRYYLFYSGNWWESHEYAVGYAVCDTETGPCVKPQDKPIFAFTPEVMGPGGSAFFTDIEGNLWMAYHAWTGIDIGYPQGQRSLRLELVRFADGAPVISGPTSDPQPRP